MMLAQSRAQRDGERGSTLLEILFATVVGVVILGTVLAVATRQHRSRRTAEESSLAVSAMLNNLEQVRSVPVDYLPTLDGSGFDVPGSRGGPNGLHPVPNDIDGLPGELEVTLDQSAGGNELYRVRATVRWAGVSGRRSMTLETLVGDRR